MSDFVDTVVVGAGVVGLAVARELANGCGLLVVDSEKHFGAHTSSRNSEVIHAGIYYPANSLKARFCVQGKHKLYEYCQNRGIPHRRTGKLIVACDAAEEATLSGYIEKAAANGVDDLRLLTMAEIDTLEPAVRCSAGVLSPSTGIVDSHALMLSFIGDIESAGGQIALASKVVTARRNKAGFEIEFDDQFRLSCRRLVNCAGLWAQVLASHIDGLPKEYIPPTYYAKAHYYSLARRSPFSRLVYPLAVGGGLGVHVTIDLAGQVRFGPDVRWVDSVDYSFDDSRREEFAEAIERYYPALDRAQLQPGYTGIRPKLVGPGDSAADFVVQGPTTHGVDGLVNLFGIESPGLTACLEIAAEVRRTLSSSS